MRVADYIANFIYDTLKVQEVYMLTGGGAMFLNDAIAKHPNIEAICNHHEQACAMASVGHAKYTNGFGVSILTTGCGATNAITGLLDAWQDNTTCFFISGQVKRKETSYNSNMPLRQFGIQEANIIPIVSSISKYSVMVNDANEIAYHLEKAYHLAITGRPGPVWIDVPLDVQGTIMKSKDLKHFKPLEEKKLKLTDKLSEDFTEILLKAKRPIVLCGNGIRLGNAIQEFQGFVEKFQIPVVSSYLAIDLLSNDNPLFIGPVGIKGDRAANFSIQNADLIIAIGNRLSVGVTGFEYNLFGRDAKLIVVDVDSKEHQKNTVRIDTFLHTDAKSFFDIIMKKDLNYKDKKEWLDKVLSWKKKWSTKITKYKNEDGKINKYTFIQALNQHLKKDSAIVSDAGSAYYVTSQCLAIKDKQRYITSGAQADMGFTIPATIGVAVAKKGEVVGITGDGSVQLNIQELQTIKHYKLPIKIFVWNNNGYLSIRATQRKFFEGRAIGTDTSSGVSLPELEKIAMAYGIQYIKIKNVKELETSLEKIFSTQGMVFCEVICPENQEIIPTVSSFKKEDGTLVSKPLEDMYPFMEREEFHNEMLIKPIEE